MNSFDLPRDRFKTSDRVVFFTGAGISAESGIATFRDLDGHWAKHDPMKLASPQGFQADPDLVLEWYAARRRKINSSQPNRAHASITEFQKLFSDSLVITQNVDGLHKRAGNHSILELHGNIHREKCFDCGKPGPAGPGEDGRKTYCSCGGTLRPDVVWFGESLALTTLNEAFEASSTCAVFFSIGTSTLIYPAAQLPYEAARHGAFVIEVNPEETPLSEMADLSLRGRAGDIMPALLKEFYAIVE